MSESSPQTSFFDALYAKCALAAVIIFIAFEVAYLTLWGLPSIAEPSLDFTGNAVGHDFLTTWMSGRSVLGYGPAAWFDPSVSNAALRVMLGPNFPAHYWSYPPHFILFTWPFGLLPYLLAYAVWCALGIALYLLAAMAFARREHLLFLAAAPGVAVCVFFGQNGFYTAALLLGGLALLKHQQQIAAGILFGILTVKPQFAMLLPIALLLTGRWWAMASAIVTSGGVVAAASHMFGPEVWTDFIGKVIPQQIWLLENGGGLLLTMVSSVFFGARLAGLPLEIAYYLQAFVSLFAVGAVIWTYWQRRDPTLSMALFVTATFLASPYVLNYDMVVFGCIVAMLHQRGDNTALDHWLGLAVWSLPVTMMLFGMGFVPIAPPLLLAFAGRLLWRLSRTEQQLEKTTPITAL